MASKKDFCLTTKDCSKITNYCTEEIRALVKNHRLKAVRDETNQRIWLISKKSLDDFCRERGIGEYKKTQFEAENISVEGMNRTFIADGATGLSKEEAERIIKQEEAISRQRENMKEEGKLIFVEDMQNGLKNFASVYHLSLMKTIVEFVDLLSLKYSLPSEEIKREFMSLYNREKKLWEEKLLEVGNRI